eukprot:1152218-Pelagomonas_calceolata.AAC.1
MAGRERRQVQQREREHDESWKTGLGQKTTRKDIFREGPIKQLFRDLQVLRARRSELPMSMKERPTPRGPLLTLKKGTVWLPTEGTL